MNNKNENKIVMSGEIVKLDDVSNGTIEIKNDTIIELLDKRFENLFIHIKENTRLELDMFDSQSSERKIEVFLEDGASFIANIAFTSIEKYSLDISVSIDGDDTNSRVKIRGINGPSGTSYITMDGKVKRGAKNAKMDEFVKILNKSDESSVVVPALIVDSNEVEANHGVAIGHLNDDEVFYLETKGIEKDDAKDLLERGFLTSILPDETKERIINILDRR